MSVTLDRVLFGPYPPVGRPYTPRAKWRCYLGVHRKNEVWAFTRTSHVEEEQDNGTVKHVAGLSVRLDREPDYFHCDWCGGIW